MGRTWRAGCCCCCCRESVALLPYLSTFILHVVGACPSGTCVDQNSSAHATAQSRTHGGEWNVIRLRGGAECGARVLNCMRPSASSMRFRHPTSNNQPGSQPGRQPGSHAGRHHRRRRWKSKASSTDLHFAPRNGLVVLVVVPVGRFVVADDREPRAGGEDVLERIHVRVTATVVRETDVVAVVSHLTRQRCRMPPVLHAVTQSRSHAGTQARARVDQVGQLEFTTLH